MPAEGTTGTSESNRRVTCRVAVLIRGVLNLTFSWFNTLITSANTVSRRRPHVKV